MSIKWSLAQFLEVRWWKNYQRSLNDDYIESKKEYWKKILSSSEMTIPHNKAILDVGCGPSGIYTILEKNKVDCVDSLIEKYEESIHFFSTKQYPNYSFHCVPFEDFEIKKEYDVVFCLNAINHFRDINSSVQKLYQSLKVGGELLVGIDGHRHTLLKKVFRTIHMDLLHPVQMSLGEYEELFQKQGFETIKTVEYTSGNIFNYYLLKLTKK